MRVPIKADTGDHALAASDLFRAYAVVLVTGQASDEGALIAEAALDDPNLNRTILRASKSLAIVNWSGDRYRERYTENDDVPAFLKQGGVTLVIIQPAATDRPDIVRLRSVVTTSRGWKSSEVSLFQSRVFSSDLKRKRTSLRPRDFRPAT